MVRARKLCLLWALLVALPVQGGAGSLYAWLVGSGGSYPAGDHRLMRLPALGKEMRPVSAEGLGEGRGCIAEVWMDGDSSESDFDDAPWPELQALRGGGTEASGVEQSLAEAERMTSKVLDRDPPRLADILPGPSGQAYLAFSCVPGVAPRRGPAAADRTRAERGPGRNRPLHGRVLVEREPAVGRVPRAPRPRSIRRQPVRSTLDGAPRAEPSHGRAHSWLTLRAQAFSRQARRC
jgi:hypothetical protein